MSITVAIDGSKFSKKALAYLAANRELVDNSGPLLLLNVQAPVPNRVKAFLSKDDVQTYYADEAKKAMAAAEKFLKQQKITFESVCVVGYASEEIIKFAKKRKSNLIVVGTHGYGVLGRTVMGSVATKVVADANMPVLLIQ